MFLIVILVSLLPVILREPRNRESKLFENKDNDHKSTSWETVALEIVILILGRLVLYFPKFTMLSENHLL